MSLKDPETYAGTRKHPGLVVPTERGESDESREPVLEHGRGDRVASLHSDRANYAL